MTPAARVQTAIECLDLVADGQSAEQALTRWARGARHAGSKDRAAVRDLVFDVMRRWWSSAAIGGGVSGRARMVGYLRDTDADPETLFTGAGYGPAPLKPAELAAGRGPTPGELLDCPPAFASDLTTSLGKDFEPVMLALRHRAPIFLRVNSRRATRHDAQARLAREGIATKPHPLSETALEVVENPRRVAQSGAFADGWVELQDAASQALVDALPLDGATRVLDYCAGGGGKSLAMAARHMATYHAFDISTPRLQAMVPRADRAGVAITPLTRGALDAQAPYDLVLVDAPCSGSGAWRRSPEGKIRLTRASFDGLLETQQAILRQAAGTVAAGGMLVYATCSLIDAENTQQVARFVAARPDFRVVSNRRWTPLGGGDGFFACWLQHFPS